MLYGYVDPSDTGGKIKVMGYKYLTLLTFALLQSCASATGEPQHSHCLTALDQIMCIDKDTDAE